MEPNVELADDPRWVLGPSPRCWDASQTLLGAGFWVKGREGGGGTPWGWVSPCPQQRCPSPQVPPLAGGDADRELQRAASLLLPAAHLPAAAAG